jgi:hypothetical protein
MTSEAVGRDGDCLRPPGNGKRLRLP